MKPGAIVAAAIASGLLLWIASPAVGLGWVAWVALVPVAAASLTAAGTRLGRLAVPLAFGVYLELLLVPAFPFGLARDQWGEPPVPILVGDSPVFVIGLVAVPLAALVLYLLRFPQSLALERLPIALRAPAAVVVPALAWTALDLVRTKFDPGGLWGPLYASQHDTDAAGLAALAGPWLVTFALVAVSYALGLAVVSPRRGRPALAALAVAALFIGPVLLLQPDDGRVVRVAAVQPGYDTAEFDLPVNHYLQRRYRDLERASVDLIEDLEPLTREAAGRGASVVVWPEATLWVDPRENERVGDRLAALAEETGVTLVAPLFIRSTSSGATLVVLRDGRFATPRPKQRPMWFLGERADASNPPAPVPTEDGAIGTMLGVDTQDAASGRRLVAAGADLLASGTHDWRELAIQHRAFARLNAATVHAPLVRSDWRYGSLIVGADGETVADAGLEKRRTVLVADVWTAPTASPYVSVGDFFGWLCLVAFAVCLAARLLGAFGETRAGRPVIADGRPVEPRPS